MLAEAENFLEGVVQRYGRYPYDIGVAPVAYNAALAEALKNTPAARGRAGDTDGDLASAGIDFVGRYELGIRPETLDQELEEPRELDGFRPQSLDACFLKDC